MRSLGHIWQTSGGAAAVSGFGETTATGTTRKKLSGGHFAQCLTVFTPVKMFNLFVS